METCLVMGTLAASGMAILGGCVAPATARSYEPCTDRTDCIYGTDICLGVRYNGASESICSSRCATGTDCPPSVSGSAGSCVTFDLGASSFCYRTCASTEGCGVSEVCATVTGTAPTQICLPAPGSAGTALAYAACAGGMTCVAGTTCTGVRNNGHTLEVCTRTHCTVDADCPADRRGGSGLCFMLDGDVFATCVERCNTLSDCTLGATEVCVQRTAGGRTLPTPACLPN